MRRLLQLSWTKLIQTPPALTSAGQVWQDAGRHLPPLAAALPSRAFASSSQNVDEESKVDYNRAVQAYKEALSGLRKKWEVERQEAARVRAESRAQREERWQAAVAQRKARREEWKASTARQLAAEQGKLQAEKAKHREKMARWRQAVESVYSIHHRRRYKSLLSQSRSWIRAEELDARIEAALDRPLQLGAGWMPALGPEGSAPAESALPSALAWDSTGAAQPASRQLAWDSNGGARPASREAARDAGGNVRAASSQPAAARDAGSKPAGAQGAPPQDTPAAEVLRSGGTAPVSSVEPEAAAAQDAARMMPQGGGQKS